MRLDVIASMADECDITPELAREILLTYSDQLAPPPPFGEEPEVPAERPPAREVDPFWKLNTLWQVLEPTVAWPIGVYNMAKMGMAASSGLPLRAALPRRLGGMTARELWSSMRNPSVAAKFQTYMTTPRATRPARPKIPRVIARAPTAARPGRPGVRPPGIPPNVITVNSWMAAAGILGAALGGPAEEEAERLGLGQPPL